jgi:benzoyl-CoA reductase/2-hydroxyglutaryl-CoA dehydratase subunit BcrC/BadD/HgdB
MGMEVRDMLERIRRGFPGSPAAMEYFYKRHQEHYGDSDGFGSIDNVIGAMCLQAPEELILAAGGRLLRLCSGAHAYEQYGSEFMPAKSCSLIKATLGLLAIRKQSGLPMPQLIVIPTTCDQRRKSVDILRDMGIDVFPLEIPANKDSEESRYYWQNSVRNFAGKLQQVTGRKITTAGLKKAILTIQVAREAYRRLQAMTMDGRNPVMFGTERFLVTNSYFFDDLESWTLAVNRLVEELNQRSATGTSVGHRHTPRILFTGSPPIFPNLKLPLLIEESGGVIVADEVCSSSRILNDTVVCEEDGLYDLIPAIADRYLKPCTCPTFVPNEDRKRKIRDQIATHGVDGVVYLTIAGCLPYDMEQRGVGNFLSDLGIPMLAVESDYSPEDAGQLSTRVEAFIESLTARKRKRSREVSKP